MPRPLGIALLSALWVLYAAIGLLRFIGVGIAPRSATGLLLERLDLPPVLVLIGVGLALLCALGLWTLRWWAWVATMLFTGLGLAGELVSYVAGQPHFPFLVLHTVMTFYLNQPEIRRRFAAAARGGPIGPSELVDKR